MKSGAELREHVERHTLERSIALGEGRGVGRPVADELLDFVVSAHAVGEPSTEEKTGGSTRYAFTD
jgi:hypothetical protein